jgi:hypothetical protein
MLTETRDKFRRLLVQWLTLVPLHAEWKQCELDGRPAVQIRVRRRAINEMADKQDDYVRWMVRGNGTRQSGGVRVTVKSHRGEREAKANPSDRLA